MAYLPAALARPSVIVNSWHVFTARDAMDLHARMKLETVQQLRGDQEVLTAACVGAVIASPVVAAGDIDHAFVHDALVARIHPLIDLIHDPEGCSR